MSESNPWNMIFTKYNRTILLIIAFSIYAAVFITDLWTPLAYSHWLLYILPVLVVYLIENTVITYIFLALSAIALIIGFMVSSPISSCEDIREISLFNRITGFAVLLIFTAIINKLIQARKHYRVLVSELEYANKELESFSYSAAHDLKAPLFAMKSFSQLLIEDYGKSFDQQAMEYLGKIDKNANNMSSLIDDMLSLSKISLKEMNLREVDISAIAESIITDLRSTAPEREVKVHIGKNMKARADNSLIRIVMANLIGNAWKYTSKKKTAEICIESKRMKNEIIFIVKDNGCGFDMSLAKDLFVPFKRLYPGTEFQGTGIGLSIVDRIIRRHRGRVWAESELNKGTTLYFTLPADSI